MFKRYLMVLTLVLALPAFANAWILNAKTSTTGQGTISPAGNKTYAAGVASDEYTVTPNTLAGYKIAKVTLDGVAYTTGVDAKGQPIFDVSGKYIAPYSATKSYRYLVAYFTKNTVDITVSAGAGGAVREDTFESLTKIPVGSARTFLVIPNPGYTIDTVTAAGATITDQANTGYKVVAFTNLQANQSVSATFNKTAVLTVNAGADKVVEGVGSAYPQSLMAIGNSNLTVLDANNNPVPAEITYNWTVKSATKLDGSSLTGGASNGVITVVADKPGQISLVGKAAGIYTLSVTASAAGQTSPADEVKVTFTGSISADLNQCTACHNSNTKDLVAEFTAGAHGAASGHTTGTCQRCHATQGALVGFEKGWTGSYATLTGSQATVWTPNEPVASNNGISCVVCHNTHDGLRPINTNNSGVVAAWDPNGNQVNNDQYDVCTACHTVTDNSGALVGNYHDKGSVSASRTISDSHFDNAATSNGTVIEGYAIRSTSANPCADCHNLHSADLTVQEQWANSAHAGHIAATKAAVATAQSTCDAAVTYFNATYAVATFNPQQTAATACTQSYTFTPAGSTRATSGTVLELFQKSNDYIKLLQAAGATEETGIAWVHYNWDDSTGTSSDRKACQRCHTSTGVSNYLTSPATYNAANNDFSHLSGWATAKASGQNELLYCWGCHSDSQTGALRNPGALTLDYSAAENDTIVYADVTRSNLCVACHSGNGGSGKSIANLADTTDFTNKSAIQPHYLAAAGVLMTASNNGGTGYEFAGRTYSKNGAHQKVGVANFSGTGDRGPCVTCHMSGTEKHTWEVSATAAVCTNCHSGLSTEVLAAAELKYEEALTAFDNALKAKGIFFVASYPYFVEDSGFGGGTANNGIIEAGEINRDNGTKNWANKVAGGNGKDTMGAAFNYNLLVHEPGAFAHNKDYAYQLMKDSTDYLADGHIDGAGIPAKILEGIEADPMIHASTVEAAASETSCATCHAPAPHYTADIANQAAYVAQQIGCADCHAGGVVSANQAILNQYAESGHGDVNGAAWVSEEMFNNSCVRCHSTTGFIAGGAPTTAFTAGESQQVLACAGCHTNLETGDVRVKGPITATYKSRTLAADGVTYNAAALATFPSVGAGNDLCISCHSGRESGESVLALTDMTNSSFKNPHYLGAAGMMYAKLAFIDFTDRNTAIGTSTYGKSLTSNEDGGALTSSHRMLGTSALTTKYPAATYPGLAAFTTGGPCVACHMVDNAGKADHTWEINGNTFNSLCNQCHKKELDFVLTADNFKEHFIEAQAEGYHAAIDLALDLVKAKYGIDYNGDSHPYWFSNGVAVKNWTTAQGFLTGEDVLTSDDAKKLMGACLNIKLMKADPAAYAHSRTYARRVLYDTIDWLDNGVIDRSVSTTAKAWSVEKNNGLFTMGASAFTGGQSTAGTTVTEGTSEGSIYLFGWDRNTGAWNTPERP